MFDVHDFAAWKKLPVTQALLERLNRIREEVVEQMLNSEVVMNSNSVRLLSQLVGLRNGLDTTIDVTFDDIKPEEVLDETP